MWFGILAVSTGMSALGALICIAVAVSMPPSDALFYLAAFFLVGALAGLMGLVFSWCYTTPPPPPSDTVLAARDHTHELTL